MSDSGGPWLVTGCWWLVGGERVAQEGVFCACGAGFFEICKNEATQAE
jgi:hypothetical protein